MDRLSATRGLVTLDQVSVGGSSRPFSEDAFGWTRTAAWLVDGATSLDASRDWAPTSARWMASTTSSLLAGLCSRPGLDARELIGGVVEGLAAGWIDIAEDESHLLPPAGSLGLVVYDIEHDRLQLTTIGDCVIVWSSPKRGEQAVVTDNVIVTAEEIHSRHVARSRLSDSVLREELIRNRRMYMEGEPGWILSTNPRVVEALTPLVVDDPVGDVVLIASDGFARSIALPDFHDSWSTLLKTVWSVGLASVLQQLRTQEREAPSFSDGRYKTSDDASALLLRVGE